MGGVSSGKKICQNDDEEHTYQISRFKNYFDSILMRRLRRSFYHSGSNSVKNVSTRLTAAAARRWSRRPGCLQYLVPPARRHSWRLGTRDLGLVTRDWGLGTRDEGLVTRDKGLVNRHW